jgi:hypothetical protein
MIGGTDDHSGLFIGKTYTCADAETPAQLLEELKMKRVSPLGRHNDFQGLAFAIYKIAYEFSKTRSKGFSLPLFNSINQLIFEQDQMGIKDKLVFKKMKYSKSTKDNTIKQLLLELVNTFKKKENFSIDAKLSCVYEKIAEVSDEFFRIFITGIEQGLSQGDITVLIKNISGAIPSTFLSLPFFSTMNLLHGSRDLLNDLTRTYGNGSKRGKTKILWFADAVDELEDNTFSFSSWSNSYGDDSDEIVVVSSLLDEENDKSFSFPFLKVPLVYTYSLPFRSNYTLIFPSLLTSLKLIYDACPDKIIVSDPGPFGFLGLFASRLLHVPCVGVYPSGMIRQAIEYVEDEKTCRMIEDFTRWFYSLTDTIAVPSEEYVDMLRIKGYDGEKISVCPIEESIDLSTSITNCKQSSEPTLLHTPF